VAVANAQEDDAADSFGASPLDMTSAAAALGSAGAEVAQVRVEAGSEPWTTTGITASQGAPITWLANGDSWIGAPEGSHLGAGFQLRVRTGMRGPALSGTGATFTTPAPHDGPIEVCCLYPGELGDDDRIVYDPMMPRALVGGGFDLVVAAWPSGTDVRQRLAEVVGHDRTGLCARELDRMGDPITPPGGWEPHRHMPLAGLHRQRDDEVDVQSRGQVEILCREAQATLTETLRLRWRWRMDQLPASSAEDTVFTHDYMSVAVEFDDGRDLTYHWSVGLPPETSYSCPFPHWREREWHLVVRSGEDGLGEWQNEERTLAADRAKAIGGETPRKVVRVWLIVTCVSGGGEARGSYGDIELVDGARAIRVL
jgi:hypothetical protein